VTSFSTPAVSEAGKAIALAVVLSVLVAYVPLVALVLAVLLPLPIAYLTLHRGARVGAAAALATGVLAVLLTGPAQGLVSVLLAGGVGLVMGEGLRRNWGFSTILLVVTGAVAASLAFSTAAIWTVTGVGWQEVTNTFDQSIEAATEMYRAAGVAEESIRQATEQVREALDMLPYLAPAILGVSGLLFACASLGLAAVIFSRMGETGVKRLSFMQFRLHWSLAYGFIGGFGLFVLSRFFPSQEEPLRLVGLNLYVFFQTIFFLQGLAIAHWLTVTRRMSAGSRFLVYTVALAGQLVLQLLSWAGLFDTWLDYRKRFAPPPNGPPEAASAGGGPTSHKED
jgi:uncharacterized protein YybS (DUF2232 family)